MLFDTPIFLFFLVIVALCYWCLGFRQQNRFLLVASYFFYARGYFMDGFHLNAHGSGIFTARLVQQLRTMQALQATCRDCGPAVQESEVADARGRDRGVRTGVRKWG